MNKELAGVIEQGRLSVSFVEEERDAWTDPTRLGVILEDDSSGSAAGSRRDRIQGWTDIKAAIAMTWRTQRRHLFTSWVHVPTGILIMLLVTWGLHLAIEAAPFSFPAPLMTMMIFFQFLLILDGLSLLFPGKESAVTEKDSFSTQSARQTSRRRFLDPIMKFVAPPCDFLLRNMSVLFTTSFVMLPARDKTAAREVALIIVWFIVTAILALLFPIGFNLGLSSIIDRTKHVFTHKKRTGSDVENGERRASFDSQETAVDRDDSPNSLGLTAGHRAQLAGNAIETARQQGQSIPSYNLSSPGWGRSSTELRSYVSTFVHPTRPTALNLNAPLRTPVFLPPSPKTAKEDASISEALAADAVEQMASRMANWITPIIYTILFLVGIPLFYVLNFSLVLFLALNVLTYMISIRLPPAPLRQILHPIIVGSCLTMFGLWAFGATKGMNMLATLQIYNRGNARYTDLLDPKGYHGPVPGAGDVFASILDAGIVALALPMYRYRYDLRDNFIRVILTLIPCSALALFAWPVLGKLIGLHQVDALTFAARFLSSPLAVEMARGIDADESLVTVLVTFTGLIIAIIKDPLFKLLRVPETDFLTWGVTIGSTAGAIGTASLVHNPRAMAISSLTFVLFGTILLITVAFDPVVDLIQNLTGGHVTITMSVGLGR